MKRPKRTPRRINILKPHEFQALLTHATPEVLPAIVLGGFCGLRPSEILDLDWSAIDFEVKKVTVSSEKTSRSRVIPIPKAATAWLVPIAKDAGPIIPSHTAYSTAAGKTWKAAGVKRQTNSLRTSAGSYMFAAARNALIAASEIGISLQHLETQLKDSISKEDINAWFNIYPKS